MFIYYIDRIYIYIHRIYIYMIYIYIYDIYICIYDIFNSNGNADHGRVTMHDLKHICFFGPRSLKRRTICAMQTAL